MQMFSQFNQIVGLFHCLATHSQRGLDGTCLCNFLYIVFILNLLFRRLNQREHDALQKNFLCCSAYLLHFGGSKSSGSVTYSFVVIYHLIFTEFDPNGSVTSSFVVIHYFIFTEFDPYGSVTSSVDVIHFLIFTEFDPNGSVTSSFVVIYHFIFTVFDPNLTSSVVVIHFFIFTEFDPNDQVEVVGPVSTNDPE